LNFRHLLERHQLTEAIFNSVRRLLEQRKLLLHYGTIVDATIVPAPPSTKNREHARDSDMSATKKGNAWHFGMKAHIGVDAIRGLIHTVKVTTARVADNVMLPKLVHGREEALFGDKAYGADTQWEEMHRPKVIWGFMRKAPRLASMGRSDRRFNREVSSIRAKVEFPFRVIKRQFGYQKTRYRGIAKNAAHMMMLFALTNLYLARRDLRPAG
jgi:IS5 family transposase